MARLLPLRMPLSLLPLWLLGCIQASTDAGPCPCVAPAQCCAPLDLCLPPETECPGAGPSALTIATVEPVTLPREGGALTLTLERAVTDPEVRVGGLPCPLERADGPTLTCTVSPNPGVEAEQPVRVRGVIDDVALTGWASVRQGVAPFVDMTGPITAPGGQSITVARLDGEGPDLIFTRGSTEWPAGVGSHWAWDGPWHWRDVSAGGLVDALPALVSITPIHLDGDEHRDLLVNWGRNRAQNQQLLRALDGETGFRDILTLDVPALAPEEDVRVLPITWDRRTAVLGVRGATPAVERTVFLLENGREQQPSPFVPPADWSTATTFDLAFVDADQDGRADLFGCAEQSYVLRRTADGFEHAPSLLPAIFLYCRTVTTGDLDLDGRIDVIATGPSQGTRPQNTFQGVRLLRNTPDGFELVPALTPATACPAPVWVGSALPVGTGAPAVLDVDLDGDLDLVVFAPSEACPDTPILYRNTVVPTGTLDFDPEPLDMGWRHVSVAASVVDDLDGDGDADVVFNGWGTNARASVWRNTAVEAGARGRVITVRLLDGGRPVHGAVITADLGAAGQRRAISGHTAVRVTDGPTRIPVGAFAGAIPLEVRWPDGQTQRATLPADARHVDIERAP